MGDHDTARLPTEYREFLARLGPGEGFLGPRFLRLYALDELASANDAYAVQSCFPQHQLFGSNGIGSAFLFDLRRTPAAVVEVPFIPLDPEFVDHVYPDFVAFVQALSAGPAGNANSSPRLANPATHGLELHLTQPLVFDGDPVDENNKVLVSPLLHAQASTYWNRMFRDLRAKTRAP